MRTSISSRSARLASSPPRCFPRSPCSWMSCAPRPRALFAIYELNGESDVVATPTELKNGRAARMHAWGAFAAILALCLLLRMHTWSVDGAIHTLASNQFMDLHSFGHFLL